MSECKEFLGRTLDMAIADACAFFGTSREKLEIEIIEDAKTGIFGIVGARKAKIRACVRTLPEIFKAEKNERPAKSRRERNERPERPERESRPEKAEKPEIAEQPERSERKPRREPRPEAPKVEAPIPEEEPIRAVDESFEYMESPLFEKTSRYAPRSRRPRHESTRFEHRPRRHAPQNFVPMDEQPVFDEDDDDSLAGKFRREQRMRNTSMRRDPHLRRERSEETEGMESTLPRTLLVELDQEKLMSEARRIISNLVAPVLGLTPEEVPLSLEINDDRLCASVQSEETGLLIGRDGQNLAAVQYLASRMITHAMNSQVRVQMDAGDYHMRQDSRLHELALILADKVRATGKTQTTRPLSAYQRRVVHMALQDDPDVVTRSSGEGALKHVVILRKKDEMR